MSVTPPAEGAKISGPKTLHPELLETNSSPISWQQDQLTVMQADVEEVPCPVLR